MQSPCSAGHTGRLYDRLVERLGKQHVFLDIDNIPPGVDFVDAIDRTLNECAVVAVIVGPRWLQIQAPDGTRRIDGDMDFHRLELERSLERGMRLIPVLVGGASMPQQLDLPESLRRLARRNAFEVSDKRFTYDAGRLAEALEAALAEEDQRLAGLELERRGKPQTFERAKEAPESGQTKSGGSALVEEPSRQQEVLSSRATRIESTVIESEAPQASRLQEQGPNTRDLRRTTVVAIAALLTGVGVTTAITWNDGKGNSGPVPSLTEGRTAGSTLLPPANTKARVYVVGTDAVYAPFESQNERGEIVGFDVDVMQAIAAKAGFEVKFVQTNWEDIFKTLDQGDLDMIISAVAITDSRKKERDFSDPYFDASQLIAVKEGSKVTSFADLKKLKVGVQTGTTGDEAVTKLLGKTSTNIKRFDSMSLAMKELESGGVEAVVADNGLVIYHVVNNPSGKFKTVADKEFVPEQYGIAIKKGNAELLQKVNEGLAAIRADGTYNKVYARYFERR